MEEALRLVIAILMALFGLGGVVYVLIRLLMIDNYVAGLMVAIVLIVFSWISYIVFKEPCQ